MEQVALTMPTVTSYRVLLLEDTQARFMAPQISHGNSEDDADIWICTFDASCTLEFGIDLL